MRRKTYLRSGLFIFILSVSLMKSCSAESKEILTGADQLPGMLGLLEGKDIAIVANHTSLISDTHLVDTLLQLSEGKFKIVRVFSPEHGFRGSADAGAHVEDQLDIRTGLPIISLYGNNRKPTASQLEGLDLVVFDLQDVGARFFTYISTMHYMMEACAENGISMLILDRPNPNGNYIDGPVLEEKHQSFVGMHPIPVVHALTVGELALMINGEGWLKNGIECDLQIISCLNYTHSKNYELPVAPSPNLPGTHTIRMYPSTCFFEGTILSEGRGTYYPFEVYGHPDLPGDFSFTPLSIEGMSMTPKLKGQECFGEDLRSFVPGGGWQKLELRWLIDSYNKFPDKDAFFIPYFETLAGTDSLRKQLQAGWSEDDIRASWKEGLDHYRKVRLKYLLYPD